MDFFNRTTPVYKRANASKVASAQPVAPNKLSGLFGSLLGRTTPAYKTVDGGAYAYAPASSGFWSMFSASPSYKTAPAAIADDAGPSGVDACDADDVGPDQVVVL